jgi:myo-inositol 2-dehydrogenase/D-chiro-inositol 1-dehydrogenase
VRKLRVGIIGLGRIGRMHARNIKSIIQADLAAISDISEEAVNSVAEELQINQKYYDYREMLNDPSIEAVVICSSTNTHAQIIKEAASAKKHIFCEKPIALTIEEVNDALNSINISGIKFFLGFNRRFDPTFSKMKEEIKSGKIGTPHLAIITSRDPAPPSLDYVKSSGGLFLDMTIHDFDMARFMLNDEPYEIYVSASSLVDPAIGKAGDVDTAAIVITMKSGARVIINNSRKAVYGYDQRVEIFGSEGMIMNQNMPKDFAFLSNPYETQLSNPVYFFIERYKEAYIHEIETFISCVMQDEIPPVGGEDGKISLLMGYAAQKSLTENRPVKFSEVI